MDKLQINKLHGDTLGEVVGKDHAVHVCALYVVSSSANGAISETFLMSGMK